MSRILKLVLLFVSNLMYGQTYYPESLESLYGQGLRVALHNLIDDHTEYSYSTCKTILKETDEDPNDNSSIVLVYKQNSINKEYFAGGLDASTNDYWNREHVWAKSLGSFGPGGIYENGPANTDVHNLKPADMSVNADRGNLSFDNGGVEHSENPNVRYTDTSWEVPDNVKGDVARILFYMDVRYEGGIDEPDLTIVEMLDTYPNPYIGKLSTLLEWHDADPVDAFEMNRNEVIYSWQNNRNPFIDHPEYVNRIWGEETLLSSDSVSHLFISEYLEGSSYNKAIELFNPSSQEVDLSDYELWHIFNGGSWAEDQLPLSGTISPGETFVVCNPNADQELINQSDIQLGLLFNGNDAVALSYLGQVVDQIGEAGAGPAEAWPIDSILTATKNNGLIRKQFVHSGTTDWLAASGQTNQESEWIVKSMDDFSTFGQHDFQSATIMQINQGWSMIGFNIDITSYAIPDLFSSIQNNLIIVKNSGGDVYLPEWEFNNIESVAIGEGLIVKVSGTAELSIMGPEIDLEMYPLALSEGWSCKSYMKNSPVDVQYFLLECPNIVIVKDHQGNAYLPAYNFNGIGSFEPGRAYMFKLSGSCEISW